MVSSPIKIFLLIIWPYFLNDFLIIYSDIYQVTWPIYIDNFLYFVPAPVTIYFLWRRKLLDLSKLGWPNHNDFFEQEIYAMVYSVLFIFVFQISWTHGIIPLWQVFPWLHAYSFTRPFENEETVNWWPVIYGSLSAGIYEEIIFRGIYTRLFKPYFKRRAYFLFWGAAIFSLIHWCNGPLTLIHIFLWGFLALWLYDWKKRLLSLTIMHIAYDFVHFGRLL